MTVRFSSSFPVVATFLAVTLSACSGSGFSGGGQKIEPAKTGKPAQQRTDAAGKTATPVQPTAPVSNQTNAQPPQTQTQTQTQPNQAVDAIVQPANPPPAAVVNPPAVVPSVQPVAPQPVAPQPVAPQPVAPQPVAPQPVVPVPPSKPDDSVSAGQLRVAATCYVNMEQGYHGTDENYIVQLKDGSGVVAAGHATIDAVRNGQPTDGDGAYPGVQLNFDLTYVRPGAQSGSGDLSVCYSDPNVAPEKGSCQDKSGQFGGGGDRPAAIKSQAAQWTVTQGASGKPELTVNGNYNLSTHHPVWAYAAPGKCFKDFQSPIVMDLDGNGRLDLVDVWNDVTTVRFDLMGEGKKTRTGWVKAQDGFLALDLNGNGAIDSGLELFGEYTQGTATKAAGEKSFANGFAALAQYDANQDGVIDEKDPIFSKLVVWQDLNQDGVTQLGEVKSLKALGIISLSLAYEKTGNVTPTIVANNEVRLKATFAIKNTKTGKVETRQMADVWFKQRRYTDGQVARATDLGK